MSFTKHHNLETVAQGVDNWDAPVNENFDQIDKGPTIKSLAGETLSAYKVVYREIDNTIRLAIAGTTGDPSSRFIGFTRESFDLGEDGYAQHSGWVSDPDWSLSVSSPYYLSTTTAGEMTSSKPSSDPILVGFAIGTNEILIKPWVEGSGGSGDTTPPGSLIAYAGSTAPGGWLLCYGQAISRSTYVDLFNVVSTTYGVGDGSTTFNIPDMRGRIPLPLDNLGGASANRITDSGADSLNGTGGLETHTLLEAELPSHSHTLSTNGDYQSGGGSTGANGSAGVGGVTSTTGSGTAHNNVQPFIGLSYIIKI